MTQIIISNHINQKRINGMKKIKEMNFGAFDPISIDFCENLLEYCFVWNQFLIIKTIRKNAEIFYKFNILAFFFISLVWVMILAKILNLSNISAFFLIFLWLKTDFTQKSIHVHFHKIDS